MISRPNPDTSQYILYFNAPSEAIAWFQIRILNLDSDRPQGGTGLLDTAFIRVDS